MLTILSICSSLVIFQQNEKTSPLGLVSGCDPDRIQTCDFQNRNLTFYSAELRGRWGLQNYNIYQKSTNAEISCSEFDFWLFP